MQRKVVTVLFCDVVGSTSLGESIDPEALQALLARYFDRMREIVERHGGTVEKFIGDAVMAVFGVPVVHEDDALRACRSALEMVAAAPEVGVSVRLGLSTGEVVTGTEERLAAGDPVNVAARLEQAAEPGEVLVNAPTLALVRASVEVESIEPLQLKGKADPLPAFRLLAVHEAAERRHEGPFVGRAAELGAVADAWRRTTSEDRCELVSVVGDAGVGKTRLVVEALAAVDGRVVRGRCLPYGEGITYWPVIEVVKQLGSLPEGDQGRPLRSLLGITEETASTDEIAWAFRKLLETTAPLVVVFDDIHWGEATFLDLVESLPLLSSGAAVLLVCIARPELLDSRPGWPAPIRLEPLADAELTQLIGDRIPEALREGVLLRAGGNPLFAEEMVALADEPGSVQTVPPTLQALLAARLDQLDLSARVPLERGAVEGEVFHRGAVKALVPDASQLDVRLAGLVRRGLIRPERAQLPGDDAYRFRHLLIRDAAYDALPKAERARLHERFAAWLEEHGATLFELDEIMGHHLELAARYRNDLGTPDEALAERAATRLAAAGREALGRGDVRAAKNLLERALQLIRRVRTDVNLELDLARTVYTSNLRLAAEIAMSAAEHAAEHDQAGKALASTAAAAYEVLLGEQTVDTVEALVDETLPLLEATGDHIALMHLWWVVVISTASFRANYDELLHASQELLRHSRLAGMQTDALGLEAALVLGPQPADRALEEVDRLLPSRPHPIVRLWRSVLLAMLDRFDEAWPLAVEARARQREIGAGIGETWLADIAALAGDHETAEQHLRLACEAYEARNHLSLLSVYAPARGWHLCALGRHDEAEALAQRARTIADEHDVVAQALWRRVQALVDAKRGRFEDAERLAREAVDTITETDSLNYQADTFSDLGAVLQTSGRIAEARTALQNALDRYEQKKNLPMARRVRGQLSALEDEPRPSVDG